jgi:2,4-dienoyl-CoA reductase (NADPH2)
MFCEIDEAEIRRLIDAFASAAERARRAGFDAVEIHAGHGYLLNEFLSPHTNRRTDGWAGTLENRARFLIEILREVRHRVGTDLAVWCRLDGEEKGFEDGITCADAVATARLAVAAGADAIHVSRYGGPSGIGFTAMIVHERGELLPYAEAVKRAVTVPVIAVGRIDPEMAERAIADGRIDFVAMARQLLADPALPGKLAAGRREDVRPCIHCYTCVGQIFINEVVKCAVNPACAREAEFTIEPAARARNVLVVGGGPAGMEAARVAALRGHRVTLCEKERRLGGTAFFSQLVYEPNGELVRWLEGQLRAGGVAVRLGVEVTPDVVRQSGAEAVIIATGARRELPDVPGADAPNVLSGDALRELLRGGDGARAKLGLGQRLLLEAGHRVLGLGDDPARLRTLSKHWMPLGRRVAVVGGGLVGLELAEFLVERRRRVTVIEEGPCLAPQMAIPRRWRTLHILREHGAALLTGTRVTAFGPAGVECVTGDGERRLVGADTILLAAGVVPDRRLADALATTGLDVHTIGDAEEIAYLEGAILAGALVGRRV